MEVDDVLKWHCIVVERVHDDLNPLLNSVEFIWATTTVAVGDTAVLHCSFDAIFQQLRTGNVSFVNRRRSPVDRRLCIS